ncbi:MAG: dethiobiotin synthase [Mycobacterium sp.]
MTVLVITGTGTGVGKTIATAALASCGRGVGRAIAVCKPVQTGDDDDLAEVSRLSGVSELVSVARFPDALAPVAAAAVAGRSLPSAQQIIDAVRANDRPGRLTLVEGAGGLLVELAAGGITLRDIAVELGAPVLVVCEAGLGTLNHTALTLEALENKGILCAGLVIGSWPKTPGAAEEFNRGALTRLAPVRAVLPADAATLAPADFAVMARDAFDPDWASELF